MASGWAALPMPDSILDKRFLRICTLSSMADLGVTPTRADTYLNGEGHAGYDFTWGWLRNPATTPNAAFVATHPTTYRLTVGFMARQLLRAGMSSTACAHCVHSVWVELLWSCALGLPFLSSMCSEPLHAVSTSPSVADVLMSGPKWNR